jgi:hypothetical protein
VARSQNRGYCQVTGKEGNKKLSHIAINSSSIYSLLSAQRNSITCESCGIKSSSIYIPAWKQKVPNCLLPGMRLRRRRVTLARYKFTCGTRAHLVKKQAKAREESAISPIIVTSDYSENSSDQNRVKMVFVTKAVV